MLNIRAYIKKKRERKWERKERKRDKKENKRNLKNKKRYKGEKIGEKSQCDLLDIPALTILLIRDHMK